MNRFALFIRYVGNSLQSVRRLFEVINGARAKNVKKPAGIESPVVML
ncbi:hypothetical protein HGG76_00050 [Ochrobactrum tritici]|uniref:Uncharacterized protein n=1 Tax=Brucella tritici TaxID=94626 RepID=A0A7X6JBZ0_9HYPH|nr:hypothetical protein [Brucella tritici]